MNERRIARIRTLIKERAAEVIDRELADPRRGLITVTKVDVDREMASAKIYWSVLGDDAQIRTTERMLDSARGFVQKEIGKVLHTRTTPRVTFVFDETIAGAARLEEIFQELREERGESETDEPDEDPDGEPDPEPS